MATGWSFGALTAALKQTAFTETGTAVGNIMAVGTFNIGRQLPAAKTSLDLSTLILVTGQVEYVTTTGLTNAPSGLTFSGYVRILCIGATGGTQMYLMADDKGNQYVVVRTDATTQTWSVSKLNSTNMSTFTLDTAANILTLYGSGSTKVIRFGSTAGVEAAYITLDNASQSLNLGITGKTGLQIASDGTATGSRVNMRASSLISEFYGIKSDAVHVNTNPVARVPGNTQGMFLGWNDDNDGIGVLLCNKGGGSGGFKFKVSDAAYANVKSVMKVDGDGNFTAIGNGQFQNGVYVVSAAGANSVAMGYDGNIAEVAGQGSIFRAINATGNLSSCLSALKVYLDNVNAAAVDAQQNRVQYVRTGATNDFGVISRDTPKFVDAGWVVTGAFAAGNENIQNLRLLGGRIQVFRNNAWVDSSY